MIELKHASVTTHDVTLLAPVTAHVNAGETLVVRGQNGSGKTTLLRVLAGSRAVSQGSAHIAGEAIDERNRDFRRRVATMIGLPPMAPDLTVFDHVALVAATWISDPEEVAPTTHDLLAELGITPLAQRFAHELSSGQTQLFGLALVLARSFEVLILDEPEQRLDPDRVSVIAEALNARREAGATLVVATHNPLLAEAIAQHTLTLGRSV